MYDQLQPSTMPLSPIRVSLTERLNNQKRDLTERLEGVNKALECLEKNPAVQEVLDLLAKHQIY